MSGKLTSWLWNQTRSRTVLVMLLVGTFVLTSGVVPARSLGMSSSTPQQASQAISGPISELSEGEKAYKAGQFEAALKFWERAEKKYRDLNNEDGRVQSLIYQSQALKSLGFYARACEVLVSSVKSRDPEVSCSNLDREVTRGGQTTTHWDLLVKALDTNQIPHTATIWYGLGEILRSLGDLEKSEKALKNISTVTETQGAAKDLSLANTIRALGNLERDRQSGSLQRYQPWSYADQSWQQQKNQIKSATEFYRQAEERYQNIIRSNSTPKKIKQQSRINYFSLLIETNNASRVQDVWNEINPDRKPLNEIEFPNNLSGVYTQINLAKNLAYAKQALALSNTSWSNAPTWQEIIDVLKGSALQKAQQLNSNRAKSQVLGNIGSLYEYCDSLSQNHCDQPDPSSLHQLAKDNTEQALFLAQPGEMPDIAYQWQWQLGRLYKPEKDKPEKDLGKAIAFYESAVKTLESTRSSLVSAHTDVQFSFRDNLEPVYRELVSLLLPTNEDAASLKNREKALYYVEALQVAELENSLRCNLRNLGATVSLPGGTKDPIRNNTELIERILKAEQEAEQPQKAAFLYPIFLQDRLAILLKLPKEDLIYQSISLDNPSSFETTISQAKNNLTKAGFANDDKKPLITLYHWLVKPVASTLEENQVKKLIFVLDSSLREIPMAALYDGDQYLVQKGYSIAISPSIQLLKPKAPKQGGISKLLIAGSTKDLTGTKSISNDRSFNAQRFILEQINSQISAIFEVFKSPTILFKEHSQGKPFTSKNLQDLLANQQYDAIHIVAHGQFSSNPQKTVIATEDPSQPTMNINKFGEILKSGTVKQALQLLVLSSCKTAGGDNRSVLGIAGMAIRSDAIGTIAPLWMVDQSATTFFVQQFYRNLIVENMSKEDALKAAQKEILKGTQENTSWKNPYYWAAFILVGN